MSLDLVEFIIVLCVFLFSFIPFLCLLPQIFWWEAKKPGWEYADDGVAAPEWPAR